MAAGFDPAAFWTLTPRLYLIHMRGAGDRFKREAMAARVTAYNTAALTRAKKLPRAGDFIGAEKPTLRGEAALSTLRAYAARLPKKSWEEWQRHLSAH